MEKSRVCTVILNWNGWQDTVECLDSLLPLIGHDIATVVVVDNDSTDSSVEQIAAWTAAHNVRSVIGNGPELFVAQGTEPPEVVLLQSPCNRGFAAGNNFGIRFALQSGNYDFVWLLNNDTAVDSEAVQYLVNFAEANPRAGLIGSTVVEYKEPHKLQCAGGAYYHPILSINRPALAGWAISDALGAEAEVQLSYVVGAAMFIRVEVFGKVGLLNERYFLYYEELDYSLRAKQHGFTLGWSKKSIIYHKGGASAGSNSSHTKRKSSLSEYHSTLSALKFTAHFYPVLFPFTFLVRFGLKVVWAVASRRWHLLPPLVTAYRDYVTERRALVRVGS